MAQAGPAPGLPGWTPYCGTAPLPGELLGRWNLDPWLLLAFFLLPILFRPVRRRVGSSTTAAACAWVLGLILFVSPFCAATSALFSLRTVHHLALSSVLAPLLVLALPRTHRPRGSPALWTGLHALVFWAWHAPGLYAAALSSDVVYWTMQASLLGSAAGFWMVVRRAEPLVAVAALLATMVQMGLLGALLTFSNFPLYAPHLASTVAWGLTPLEDQQLAGLIMWAPGASIYLAAAAWILFRWLGRAQRPAAA